MSSPPQMFVTTPPDSSKDGKLNPLDPRSWGLELEQSAGSSRGNVSLLDPRSWQAQSSHVSGFSALSASGSSSYQSSNQRTTQYSTMSSNGSTLYSVDGSSVINTSSVPSSYFRFYTASDLKQSSGEQGGSPSGHMPIREGRSQSTRTHRVQGRTLSSATTSKNSSLRSSGAVRTVSSRTAQSSSGALRTSGSSVSVNVRADSTGRFRRELLTPGRSLLNPETWKLYAERVRQQNKGVVTSAESKSSVVSAKSITAVPESPRDVDSEIVSGTSSATTVDVTSTGKEVTSTTSVASTATTVVTSSESSNSVASSSSADSSQTSVTVLPDGVAVEIDPSNTVEGEIVASGHLSDLAVSTATPKTVRSSDSHMFRWDSSPVALKSVKHKTQVAKVREQQVSSYGSRKISNSKHRSTSTKKTTHSTRSTHTKRRMSHAITANSRLLRSTESSRLSQRRATVHNARKTPTRPHGGSHALRTRRTPVKDASSPPSSSVQRSSHAATSQKTITSHRTTTTSNTSKVSSHSTPVVSETQVSVTSQTSAHAGTPTVAPESTQQSSPLPQSSMSVPVARPVPNTTPAPTPPTMLSPSSPQLILSSPEPVGHQESTPAPPSSTDRAEGTWAQPRRRYHPLPPNSRLTAATASWRAHSRSTKYDRARRNRVYRSSASVKSRRKPSVSASRLSSQKSRLSRSSLRSSVRSRSRKSRSSLGTSGRSRSRKSLPSRTSYRYQSRSSSRVRSRGSSRSSSRVSTVASSAVSTQIEDVHEHTHVGVGNYMFTGITPAPSTPQGVRETPLPPPTSEQSGFLPLDPRSWGEAGQRGPLPGTPSEPVTSARDVQHPTGGGPLNPLDPRSWGATGGEASAAPEAINPLDPRSWGRTAIAQRGEHSSGKQAPLNPLDPRSWGENAPRSNAPDQKSAASGLNPLDPRSWGESAPPSDAGGDLNPLDPRSWGEKPHEGLNPLDPRSWGAKPGQFATAAQETRTTTTTAQLPERTQGTSKRPALLGLTENSVVVFDESAYLDEEGSTDEAEALLSARTPRGPGVSRTPLAPPMTSKPSVVRLRSRHTSSSRAHRVTLHRPKPTPDKQTKATPTWKSVIGSKASRRTPSRYTTGTRYNSSRSESLASFVRKRRVSKKKKKSPSQSTGFFPDVEVLYQPNKPKRTPATPVRTPSRKKTPKRTPVKSAKKSKKKTKRSTKAAQRTADSEPIPTISVHIRVAVKNVYTDNNGTLLPLASDSVMVLGVFVPRSESKEPNRGIGEDALSTPTSHTQHPDGSVDDAKLYSPFRGSVTSPPSSMQPGAVDNVASPGEGPLSPSAGYSMEKKAGLMERPNHRLLTYLQCQAAGTGVLKPRLVLPLLELSAEEWRAEQAYQKKTQPRSRSVSRKRASSKSSKKRRTTSSTKKSGKSKKHSKAEKKKAAGELGTPSPALVRRCAARLRSMSVFFELYVLDLRTRTLVKAPLGCLFFPIFHIFLQPSKKLVVPLQSSPMTDAPVLSLTAQIKYTQGAVEHRDLLTLFDGSPDPAERKVQPVPEPVRHRPVVPPLPTKGLEAFVNAPSGEIVTSPTVPTPARVDDHVEDEMDAAAEDTMPSPQVEPLPPPVAEPEPESVPELVTEPAEAVSPDVLSTPEVPKLEPKTPPPTGLLPDRAAGVYRTTAPRSPPAALRRAYNYAQKLLEKSRQAAASPAEPASPPPTASPTTGSTPIDVMMPAVTLEKSPREEARAAPSYAEQISSEGQSQSVTVTEQTVTRTSQSEQATSSSSQTTHVTSHSYSQHRSPSTGKIGVAANAVASSATPVQESPGPAPAVSASATPVQDSPLLSAGSDALFSFFGTPTMRRGTVVGRKAASKKTPKPTPKPTPDVASAQTEAKSDPQPESEVEGSAAQITHTPSAVKHTPLAEALGERSLVEEASQIAESLQEFTSPPEFESYAERSHPASSELISPSIASPNDEEASESGSTTDSETASETEGAAESETNDGLSVIAASEDTDVFGNDSTNLFGNITFDMVHSPSLSKGRVVSSRSPPKKTPPREKKMPAASRTTESKSLTSPPAERKRSLQESTAPAGSNTSHRGHYSTVGSTTEPVPVPVPTCLAARNLLNMERAGFRVTLHRISSFAVTAPTPSSSAARLGNDVEDPRVTKVARMVNWGAEALSLDIKPYCHGAVESQSVMLGYSPRHKRLHWNIVTDGVSKPYSTSFVYARSIDIQSIQAICLGYPEAGWTVTPDAVRTAETRQEFSKLMGKYEPGTPQRVATNVMWEPPPSSTKRRSRKSKGVAKWPIAPAFDASDMAWCNVGVDALLAACWLCFGSEMYSIATACSSKPTLPSDEPATMSALFPYFPKKYRKYWVNAFLMRKVMHCMNVACQSGLSEGVRGFLGGDLEIKHEGPPYQAFPSVGSSPPSSHCLSILYERGRLDISCASEAERNRLGLCLMSLFVPQRASLEVIRKGPKMVCFDGCARTVLPEQPQGKLTVRDGRTFLGVSAVHSCACAEQDVLVRCEGEENCVFAAVHGRRQSERKSWLPLALPSYPGESVPLPVPQCELSKSQEVVLTVHPVPLDRKPKPEHFFKVQSLVHEPLISIDTVIPAVAEASSVSEWLHEACLERPKRPTRSSKAPTKSTSSAIDKIFNRNVDESSFRTPPQPAQQMVSAFSSAVHRKSSAQRVATRRRGTTSRRSTGQRSSVRTSTSVVRTSTRQTSASTRNTQKRTLVRSSRTSHSGSTRSVQKRSTRSHRVAASSSSKQKRQQFVSQMRRDRAKFAKDSAGGSTKFEIRVETSERAQPEEAKTDASPSMVSPEQLLSPVSSAGFRSPDKVPGFLTERVIGKELLGGKSTLHSPDVSLDLTGLSPIDIDADLVAEVSPTNGSTKTDERACI